MSRLRRRIVLGLSAVTALALVPHARRRRQGMARKPPADLPKVPLMVGSGGAVSSVDREASQIGIEVLARGGNAADAAVATAAALGVTEPYSAGIGGAGSSCTTTPKTKKVSTIDGRETAPKSFTPTVFQSPDGTRSLPGGGRLGPLGRHPGHAPAVGRGRSHPRDMAAR